MSALPGKFSSIADAVKIGVDPWHFVCLVSIEADFGRKYQQGLKGTAVDAVGHDHGAARIPALVWPSSSQANAPARDRFSKDAMSMPDHVNSIVSTTLGSAPFVSSAL